MILIKNMSDIENMRKRLKCDNSIIEYLKEYFQMLVKTLSDNESPEKLTLEKSGYIVYLENAADCRSLVSIGIDKEYKNTLPEYIEAISLSGESGEIELYKTTIVINNDFAIDIFSSKGTLDEETERFLYDECS